MSTSPYCNDRISPGRQEGRVRTRPLQERVLLLQARARESEFHDRLCAGRGAARHLRERVAKKPRADEQDAEWREGTA